MFQDVDGLQDLLWGFASQRVITVAVRNGVFRHLAQEAMAPEALAEQLGLDPLATGKLLRALTALGLLEPTGGAYRLAKPLVSHFQQDASDLTPFVEHLHGMYERWGQELEAWLRGESVRRSAPDPRRFGLAMQAMGRYVAQLLVQALDLTGVARALDVGGGLGHYVQALCRAQPTLSATVLDRPEVAALGRQAVAGSELEDRIAFIGGDYLTADYGQGFDLVLNANILHQESQERASTLVRKSAAALAKGGRLAVLDFAIDEEQQRHVFGCLFAINMRSFGDTHPETRIRGWMEDAGLVRIQRRDLGRHRWLILGQKAAA